QERVVLTTHVPPDDRSIGYERGNAISRAWDNATTDAAIEVANYVATHRLELAGVKEPRRTGPPSPSFRNFRRRPGDDNQTADTPEERNGKVVELCSRFVEYAFRKPLADGERQVF